MSTHHILNFNACELKKKNKTLGRRDIKRRNTKYAGQALVSMDWEIRDSAGVGRSSKYRKIIVGPGLEKGRAGGRKDCTTF